MFSRKNSRRGSKKKLAAKAFFLNYFLHLFGLYERGFRNYLNLHVIEREVHLPRLPIAFEGFRLLQLSDLHCNLADAFLETLLVKLKSISCDATVLTGDYSSRVGYHQDRVLQDMKRILDVLPQPCWGVLGNYDLLELVPYWESNNLRILLNEYDEIKRGEDRLFICGVDDPVFFRTHDLVRARTGIPEEACTILLAHSPGIWREAATLGYSLMLCGHTHGGQVCWPGGRPILSDKGIPRSLMCGEWREGALSGYTSSGTGASQLPVRFNCPAEITIHILRNSKKHLH